MSPARHDRSLLRMPRAPHQLGHSSDRWPLLVLVAALLLFLALGIRLIPIGSGDLGIAGLFSTDEQLAGELVRAMVQHSNLGLSHFFSYGPLDLYAARVLLLPYGAVRPVDDQTVLIALRLVSLVSGAGCLLLTYLLGLRLWNSATGALAALLLAAGPTFLTWSTTAHPDVLQLLFLLLGLYFAISPPMIGKGAIAGAVRPLLWASLFAGLAFATKYGGVLLLPSIWLAVGLRLRSCGKALRLLRVWLRNVVLSTLVFAAVFLLIDPSAFGEPRRFLSQARVESDLAHRGHLFLADGAPVEWLRLLGGGELLGPVGVLLAVAGVVVWSIPDLRTAFPRLPPYLAPAPGQLSIPSSGERGAVGSVSSHNRKLEPVRPARLPLAAWTLGYLLFLLVWVGDRQARYLLPILPGLLLYAAASAVWLSQRLPARPIALILLTTFLLLPLGLRLKRYEQIQAVRMSGPAIASRIEAGRWLAMQVAPNTPILRDAYTYLPPSFTNVRETFGLTTGQIEQRRPQIIMTDAAIRDRFLDPTAAIRYRNGEIAYQEIAAMYRALDLGGLACYPSLRTFGPVHIYGRLSGETCP